MKRDDCKSDDFKKGRLLWFAGNLTAKELAEKYLNNDWDDGFVAFSNAEKRFNNFGGVAELKTLLSGRIQDQEKPQEERADGLAELEGYLMEAGLWRHKMNTAVYEELSFDREGDNFFVQYWHLSVDEKESTESWSCYFRTAKTFVRGNLKRVFSEKSITTFEVIVPEKRLRFYITKGGSV